MKTVVVTGAASGMGLSTSKLFLEKGWQVILADFNQAAGEKIAFDLSKHYSNERVLFHKTNVAEAASVKSLREAAKEKFGTVDTVVNNAGIFTKGALHEVSEKAWDRIMAVDVKSIFLMTKYFVPDMIAQKYGTIVNTASISGLTGDYNMAAYNAAKGAVVNLVRAMALDYGKYNIRVNNVAPGPTNTPMFQANPQSVIDKFKKASPLGRLVEPDEIAETIYFLASENSRSITGQNISVSTGYEIYSGQPVQ
ncbi:3-oxoacyl-[acyl-carrier protein] reductase [Liquorilactobacillus sucicola DSM 21376 = JCM 15457]|uniref:Short chain dehydrogenase n=1 Tax=Liquorilactobacillus sucicola DSM 21376 = JCM 15457 TaxID=1423806 RepID=A0A023CUB6_9LACO|nr:SDR family oxidoreductase [Liquorilactobacillus sucicola]KRN05327.1 short chain dehydrogenase [Liquorilactobacillus sucicola DSM 21376 = JCM 15457]GAJ25394.1 3-oxoacyl-[acyl-carrier protein] reductase [Liquorilactobacillus sucicola DSM 21376 = JCM 15457]